MITMEEFIERNGAEIKAGISKFLNHVPRQASCDCPKSGTDHYHNDECDEDLEDWILNDEGLYNWARREGVDI